MELAFLQVSKVLQNLAPHHLCNETTNQKTSCPKTKRKSLCLRMKHAKKQLETADPVLPCPLRWQQETAWPAAPRLQEKRSRRNPPTYLIFQAETRRSLPRPIMCVCVMTTAKKCRPHAPYLYTLTSLSLPLLSLSSLY